MPAIQSATSFANQDKTYTYARKQIKTLAGLNNEQICGIAINKAHKDASNSKTAKLGQKIPAFILATGLAAQAALTTNGALSKKIGVGAGLTALFVALNVALKGFGKITDKIAEKNQNKEKKMSPVLKATLNLAGMIGTLALVAIGAPKAITALATKTNIGKHAAGFIGEIGKKIDKFEIGQRFSKSVDAFFGRHPGIKYNAWLAPVAASVASSVGLGAALNKQTNKQIEKNIQTLSVFREEAKAASSLFDANDAYTPESDAECDAVCQLAKEEAEAAQA